jgi:hypothetical protein
LRGPGRERIVEVVPGGMELEFLLRRGVVGQAAHTRCTRKSQNFVVSCVNMLYGKGLDCVMLCNYALRFPWAGQLTPIRTAISIFTAGNPVAAS